MKAPNKCPMCGEKKKWIKVDQKKLLNGTGAVTGAVLGSVVPGVGTLVGGLIGSAMGKSKKAEQYCCGKCGFSHIYEG